MSHYFKYISSSLLLLCVLFFISSCASSSETNEKASIIIDDVPKTSKKVVSALKIPGSITARITDQYGLPVSENLIIFDALGEIVNEVKVVPLNIDSSGNRIQGGETFENAVAGKERVYLVHDKEGEIKKGNLYIDTEGSYLVSKELNPGAYTLQLPVWKVPVNPMASYGEQKIADDSVLFLRGYFPIKKTVEVSKKGAWLGDIVLERWAKKASFIVTNEVGTEIKNKIVVLDVQLSEDFLKRKQEYVSDDSRFKKVSLVANSNNPTDQYLAPGTYTVQISSLGYETLTTTFEVKDNDDDIIQTFVLKKSDEEKMEDSSANEVNISHINGTEDEDQKNTGDIFAHKKVAAEFVNQNGNIYKGTHVPVNLYYLSYFDGTMAGRFHTTQITESGEILTSYKINMNRTNYRYLYELYDVVPSGTYLIEWKSAGKGQYNIEYSDGFKFTLERHFNPGQTTINVPDENGNWYVQVKAEQTEIEYCSIYGDILRLKLVDKNGNSVSGQINYKVLDINGKPIISSSFNSFFRQKNDNNYGIKPVSYGCVQPGKYTLEIGGSKYNNQSIPFEIADVSNLSDEEVKQENPLQVDLGIVSLEAK